jgi:hypothetical protein
MAPAKTMQLGVGFIFTDPRTNFTWEIVHPWVSRWRKRQLGWICKRAGFNPLQYPVSNWYEDDIISVLKQVELTRMQRMCDRPMGTGKADR